VQEPKVLKSKRFFSEERYHYTQNKRIEIELKNYKVEIEQKFRNSELNRAYAFPRREKREIPSPAKNFA
jgi:hypothetical protein